MEPSTCNCDTCNFWYLLQLCRSLAEEYDTIRSEYWNFLSRILSSKYGSEKEAQNSSWQKFLSQEIKWYDGKFFFIVKWNCEYKEKDNLVSITTSFYAAHYPMYCGSDYASKVTLVKTTDACFPPMYIVYTVVFCCHLT